MANSIVHSQKVQDWILGVLAIALFSSPWLLGFGDHHAEWSAWLGAVALAYLASASLFDASLLKVTQWEEWATAAVGLWLIIAPELLHFGQNHPAQWTHWLVGGITLIVSLWAEWSYRHPMAAPKR
ncbi:SPW repeat protein [Labrys okinawensis]|uniref:SPW repeat protein n=1 Tax=Labrys okinawensis TaxID=346911 RepID=UPI0039BC2DDF